MLEILAQLIPLMAMQDVLSDHIVLFMDNEPGRQALNKDFGKDERINKMIQFAWMFAERKRWWPEWRWVASSANVSDQVNRFGFVEAYSGGWQWWPFELDEILCSIAEACLE